VHNFSGLSELLWNARLKERCFVVGAWPPPSGSRKLSVATDNSLDPNNSSVATENNTDRLKRKGGVAVAENNGDLHWSAIDWTRVGRSLELSVATENYKDQPKWGKSPWQKQSTNLLLATKKNVPSLTPDVTEQVASEIGLQPSRNLRLRRPGSKRRRRRAGSQSRRNSGMQH